MTTRDKYTEVPVPYAWEVPSVGDARFTWEYDEGRARLLSLYQKGKDKQWDAQSRIDWSLDVDPMNPIGMPDEFQPLFGSPAWESADESRRAAGGHPGGCARTGARPAHRVESFAAIIAAGIFRERTHPPLFLANGHEQQPGG